MPAIISVAAKIPNRHEYQLTDNVYHLSTVGFPRFLSFFCFKAGRRSAKINSRFSVFSIQLENKKP